jgi:uncharacterized protein (DUF885 family)
MRIMPLAVLLLATMPCLAAADDASTQLQKALDAIQAFRDREDPMEAIAKGRPADATRIQDRSMAAIERRQKETAQLLAALKAVDRAALTESERLDTELIERELSMDLEGHRFAGYLLVLGPLGGPQQSVPQMVEQMPLARADDLRNHLARLTMVPQALRNERALLEEGLRRGITPPKAILAGVPMQFDAVIAGKLQALREPFERTYPDLSPEQAAQLKAQGNAAVDAVLLADAFGGRGVDDAPDESAAVGLPESVALADSVEEGVAEALLVGVPVAVGELCWGCLQSATVLLMPSKKLGREARP